MAISKINARFMRLYSALSKKVIMKNKFSKLYLFELILYLNTLLILLFLCFAIFTKVNTNFTVAIIILCIWAVAFIAVSIALLMDTIILVKSKNESELFVRMKKVKYFTIPYFIFNFIFLSVLMIGLIMGTRGIGILLLPIPFILMYFVVVATSFYGIGFLFVLYRKGKIVKKKYVLFIILHLTFVLDIVSTMFLIKSYRNNYLPENSKEIEENLESKEI